MLIGYMRVSKSDGSQTTDLQKDALLKAGVEAEQIFEDLASGKAADRPGLAACLRTLRAGDTLLVWKLDRLGRDLKNLIGIVRDLETKKVGFKVLTGSGAEIDTTTANGRLVFGIFAALAEYERDLIVERTMAGLAAARARGRQGGAEWKMSPMKIEMARAALAQKETNVSKLCSELRISRQTLYRHLSPQGELRSDGKKLLEVHAK